jgi:hypothetical protein
MTLEGYELQFNQFKFGIEITEGDFNLAGLTKPKVLYQGTFLDMAIAILPDIIKCSLRIWDKSTGDGGTAIGTIKNNVFHDWAIEPQWAAVK